MERFEALRADVTLADTPVEAARAFDRYAIRGVPTVVFLGPDGAERRDFRLEGYEGPEAFVRRLEEVVAPGLE